MTELEEVADRAGGRGSVVDVDARQGDPGEGPLEDDRGILLGQGREPVSSRRGPETMSPSVWRAWRSEA